MNYLTAKIVILGDPGVGKTSLGQKLARSKREEKIDQVQNLWIAGDFSKTLDDGTKFEVVLWDLAGIPQYQTIHSIQLDDVDLALVLFDPTNRLNTLSGVEFWLDQLSRNKDLPPCIVVGTRVDRGGLAISKQEVIDFCQSNGIKGGYVETSVDTGQGINELREMIKAEITCNGVRDKTTINLFDSAKTIILERKASQNYQDGILAVVDFVKYLNNIEDSPLSDEDILVLISHLCKHGYVEILRNSIGETFLLLKPQIILDLSSSIVMLAEKDPQGLGSLIEVELLRGNIKIAEILNFPRKHQRLLLENAVTRLIEHSICFRELYRNDDWLIFPDLIRQKRPLYDINVNDDVSYFISGKVKNVYTALVVLLGYTNSLKRFNQWQNQVQFEYQENKDQICGFRLIEEKEDEIEIVLYYSEQMPQKGKKSFQKSFESFLCQRQVHVRRLIPAICPNGHPLERSTVIKRLRQGKYSTYCMECRVEFSIPKLENMKRAQMMGMGSSSWLLNESLVAQIRKNYESNLVSVKTFWGQDKKPSCYISYISNDKKWTDKLKDDLNLAGVEIVEDISNVMSPDYIVVLDSPAYKTAWEDSRDLLKHDKVLIESRKDESEYRKIIWITLEAHLITDKEYPISKDNSQWYHDIDSCDINNFYNITHYPITLFNLVLGLYSIPLDNSEFFSKRRQLHKLWENTLSKFTHKADSIPEKVSIMEPEKRPLRVFISYAHEDEEKFKFKTQLIKVLAGMKRHGVIDTWEDSQIRAGDDWYQEIQTAMSQCDLALLLVSFDFIASPFINKEEVPLLLKRRQSEGMRVIPIIIRPCYWEIEPVLKDLQVLPKYGKPVISFSQDPGGQDKAWKEIAQEIENVAKDLRSDDA